MNEQIYTQEQLEQMDNRELDAVVAEVIFNAEKVDPCRHLTQVKDLRRFDDGSKYGLVIIVPHYSTNANEAVKVLELVLSKDTGDSLYLTNNGWQVSIWSDDLQNWQWITNKSFCRAICTAAVLACQEMENE